MHGLYNRYTKLEPAVTATLQNLCHDVGGTLRGLEYKLKSETSVMRACKL